MNNPSIDKEEGPHAVDDLLHDFFQSTMPKPWPRMKVGYSSRPRLITKTWSRYSGRLALAACITLLVSGYLTLAGFFHHQPASANLETIQPNIGMNPKSPRKLPSTSGTHHPAMEDHSNDRIMLEPMVIQSSSKKSQ